MFSCLFQLPFLLGQAKLIDSLSSGIFEKVMRAGGHFSYFIMFLAWKNIYKVASHNYYSYFNNDCRAYLITSLLILSYSFMQSLFRNPFIEGTNVVTSPGWE